MDVRTAKEPMRHATIAMTADVYAVTYPGLLTDAVKRLPDLSSLQTQPFRGTDPNDAPDVLALCLARRHTLHSASVRDGSTNPPSRRRCANPQVYGRLTMLRRAHPRKNMRGVTPGKQYPQGDSNPCRRREKPVS